MTKEVENIIRNKAYYELTSGERESVGEFAHNEEEYNNMQWFLTGTTAAFGGAKIEASSDLKKGVMAHLTDEKKKKGFWLNSVGVFMLPTNKRFYQKPAFQLGIAALVVVGLVFTLNPGVEDDGLALLDVENENTVELNETIIEDAVTADEEPALEVLSETLSDEFDTDREVAPVEMGEILELENKGNEQIMDLAPAAPAMDEVESYGEATTFTSSSGFPEMEEMSVTAVEVEEIILAYDFSDEAVELTDATNLDKEVTEKQERLENKENRRDEKDKKGKLQTVAFKKDVSQESRLINAEPSATEADDLDTTPGSTQAGGYLESDEWIKPKSMHINKTKELNALFFIER